MELEKGVLQPVSLQNDERKLLVLLTQHDPYVSGRKALMSCLCADVSDLEELFFFCEFPFHFSQSLTSDYKSECKNSCYDTKYFYSLHCSVRYDLSDNGVITTEELFCNS
jgi:hypothetical protein